MANIGAQLRFKLKQPDSWTTELWYKMTIPNVKSEILQNLFLWTPSWCHQEISTPDFMFLEKAHCGKLCRDFEKLPTQIILSFNSVSHEYFEVFSSKNFWKVNSFLHTDKFIFENVCFMFIQLVREFMPLAKCRLNIPYAQWLEPEVFPTCCFCWGWW